MTVLFSVLAVFAMGGLIWLARGWMLLPGPCPVEVVIPAAGTGDGLEQTVRGLLWLRRTGLLRCTLSIRDEGLTEGGTVLALLLARQEGVELRR